jgi:small GTP-binding protein
MGLNETPLANRVHIGFFGRRNAGKSSLLNALTGQETAIVSETRGTTTDPVYKAMELLPLGPVMIIDTPGIDDSGALGEQRVQRAKGVLNKTGMAVLAVDAVLGKSPADEELIALFKQRGVNYLVAYTKGDLLPPGTAPAGTLPPGAEGDPAVLVSAKTGAGLSDLYRQIAGILAKTAGIRSGVGAALGSSRQKELISEAIDGIEDAIALYEEGLPADLIAPCLRSSVNSLGEITGEVSNADLLEVMFSRLCREVRIMATFIHNVVYSPPFSALKKALIY